MGKLVLNVPDGLKTLDEREKAALMARLDALVSEAVRSHHAAGDAAEGSLMKLAGRLRHGGRPIPMDEARERLLDDVADDFRGRQA